MIIIEWKNASHIFPMFIQWKTLGVVRYVFLLTDFAKIVKQKLTKDIIIYYYYYYYYKRNY